MARSRHRPKLVAVEAAVSLRRFRQTEVLHLNGRTVRETVEYVEYAGPGFEPGTPMSQLVYFARPDGAVITHNLGKAQFDHYLAKGFVPVLRSEG